MQRAFECAASGGNRRINAGERHPGLSCLVLILRAQWEDQTLQAELVGYKEYARRVRYKLIPGVW